MKIVLAQVNPVVGDIPGNISKLITSVNSLCSKGVDLIVFPELFITGYPPRDLLESDWFIERVANGIEDIKRFSCTVPHIGILFGAPLESGLPQGRGLYNAALLVSDGEVIHTQHKSLLPSYDVFDEGRYFDPGKAPSPVCFKGEQLGIVICEDSWNDAEMLTCYYDFNPMETLASKGVSLFINISASPFYKGKETVRYQLMRKLAKKYRCPIIVVNQVGGNDELIFDGRSFCVDKHGLPFGVCSPFVDEILLVDSNRSGSEGNFCVQNEIESVYHALILGIKDYLEKCGFNKAVVGLSGGIDSALTCCLAQSALGKNNVLGVSLPGPYSSRSSLLDATALVEKLAIDHEEISITSLYNEYVKILSRSFHGKKKDVTEENIQARIRGNILMALSNKFGSLVLSTGNKSEIAVGYCTLYGDMSGGLSVLSDVPKTMVYELAQFVNKDEEIIPNAIIAKAPTAELRPNQRDQDTLPPYEVLDAILELYIDDKCAENEIVNKGFDAKTVSWVVEHIKRNEYKRRQAAPGLKVSLKAFGMGRRMPMAATY
ncbi:NAD+ synthase [Chlamydiota bacterium]